MYNNIPENVNKKGSFSTALTNMLAWVKHFWEQETFFSG